MPIEATKPTVIPAQEEKTYDKYWLKSLTINANDPTMPVIVSVELQKCRQTEDKSYELSPADDAVSFTVDDVFALAATDKDTAEVMTKLLAKVQAIGVERGAV